MAKVKSVIKSITVHYPLPENQEEFNRRFAKSAVKLALSEIENDTKLEVVKNVIKRI